MLKVSQLFIYPIKSLGGIAVEKAMVTSRGLQHDRRWMLVDENNRFLTQREHVQMALLKVSLEAEGIRVTHQTYGSVLISFHSAKAEKQQVVIWDDTCPGEYVSDELDEWFSKAINLKCRLVYMPDDSEREVDQRYARPGVITSFSDGYPCLLIGQASLDDLNSRLTKPLPMDRFRPNIVFSGGSAFEEDLMNQIDIAGINFYGVKLCARCVMTTIDQQTGIKAKEPLKTLSSYRLKNNKIMFGQNLIHESEGVISVGDELTVLSTHHHERFIINPNPSATTA